MCAGAQQSDDPKAADPNQTAPQLPSIEFGDLYRAIEMRSIFPDQKTFADAVPTEPPREVLAEYVRQKTRPGFNLSAAASETTPRTPVRATTNGSGHGGAGSRATRRGNARRGR